SDIMDVIFHSIDLIEGMVIDITEGGDGSADVSIPVKKLRAIVAGDFSVEQEIAATAVALDEAPSAEETAQQPQEYDLDDFALMVMEQS
ncbi:chemotaxis protein CheA, partial [Bacillus sp. SIMBA_069]